MDLKTRLKLALSRARYAALGAAIGAAVGGLFSRNAASTGGATGALIGALIAEKRHSAGGWFEDVSLPGGELTEESDGVVSQLKAKKEQKFSSTD